MSEQALQILNAASRTAWAIENGRLCKTFVFADFVAAFSFMSSVALLAEKAGHHPDWCNRYNQVSIELITHEAGELTDKDFHLATEIEAVAQGAGGQDGF